MQLEALVTWNQISVSQAEQCSESFLEFDRPERTVMTARALSAPVKITALECFIAMICSARSSLKGLSAATSRQQAYDPNRANTLNKTRTALRQEQRYLRTAAMKNVLSPISETIIMSRDERNASPKPPGIGFFPPFPSPAWGSPACQ